MKFRDPKTGEVFDVEHEGATGGFCAHIDYCTICPLTECAKEGDCSDWIIAHPAEAARRMGYEVIREPGVDFPMPECDPRDVAFRKEEPMDKQDKPRICEALGVEVGETFYIEGQKGSFEIMDGGGIKYSCSFPNVDELLDIINHPDRIIRKPRFTQEEVEVLRHLSNAGVVSVEKKAGTHLYWDGVDCGGVMVVPPGFLPSLRPGQSVALEDIIGGANHAE